MEKIYDERTGRRVYNINPEAGCVYPGRIKTGTQKACYRLLPGTELKELVPQQDIYEDVLLYHEYSREEKAAALREMLRDTDYVVIKIAEGVATKEEYAEVLAERARWRQEINELESEDDMDFIIEEAADFVQPVGG